MINFNPVMVSTCGYSPRELRSKHIGDLLQFRDDKPGNQAIFSKLLKGDYLEHTATLHMHEGNALFKVISMPIFIDSDTDMSILIFLI
ncbi:MAG: hypothetical protein HC842_07935 [Cytophagales bacterium]|nr:hypothetical protein [Cytophagales bacterium]